MGMEKLSFFLILSQRSKGSLSISISITLVGVLSILSFSTKTKLLESRLAQLPISRNQNHRNRFDIFLRKVIFQSPITILNIYDMDKKNILLLFKKICF